MFGLETLTSFAFRKSNFSMAHPIFLMLLLSPLAGCSGDGGGGPIISSLSTPTDTTEELTQAATPAVTDSGGEGDTDPIITMTSTPTGVTAQLTWDRPSGMQAVGYTIYYGKRSSEEPGSQEPSSEEPGSEESSSEQSVSEESGLEEPRFCSDGESQTVQAPSATITGLEPNTPYFFAIRAFNENESESLCSNEITAVTPPAQS